MPIEKEMGKSGDSNGYETIETNRLIEITWKLIEKSNGLRSTIVQSIFPFSLVHHLALRLL